MMTSAAPLCDFCHQPEADPSHSKVERPNTWHTYRTSRPPRDIPLCDFCHEPKAHPSHSNVERPITWHPFRFYVAPTFALEEVLQILRNVGIDPKCGACVEAAFTGGSLLGHSHDSVDEVFREADCAAREALDGPTLFVWEEKEQVEGGYYAFVVVNAMNERGWSEPYKKTSDAEYRSRVVAYVPRAVAQYVVGLETLRNMECGR